MSGLIRRTIVGFLELALAMGVALFVPAGTLAYWQGWVLLLVFLGSAAAITAYLAQNDVPLLERRLQAGPTAETRRGQQVVQALASVAFVGVLVLSSLDHRFGWSDVPNVIVAVGNALVLVGFVAVYFVFRENPFTAAVIEVDFEQRVISSGPYGIVRHPMYAGALVLMVGTPLALGSWWGLICVALLAAALMWRVLDEEDLLTRTLPGYAEYRCHVRWRLVPYVW
jgi:protein-S-isoprenylcysteine O-methyltransferase Ste14